MPCATLNELPAPPKGRHGWPWTESSPAPTQDIALPDAASLPLIALTTPSFNQGEFIEETIRSVLLQGYPALHYSIIDGGSTDSALEIIRKYERWIDYWISEPDRGQSHAINKGLAVAPAAALGWNWVNSDDYLLPGALSVWANAMRQHPKAAGWAGHVRVCDRSGIETGRLSPIIALPDKLANWGQGGCIFQPACLFDLSSVRSIGGVKEDLCFTMDVDLVIRLAQMEPFAPFEGDTVVFRAYPEAKTSRDLFGRLVELCAIGHSLGYPAAARSMLFNHVNAEVGRLFGKDPVSYSADLIDPSLVLRRTNLSSLWRYTVERTWRRLVGRKGDDVAIG